MIRVEARVGRLVEVRFREPVGVDELSRFMSDVRRLSAGDDRLVFVTDWRDLGRFDDATADALVWIMRRDNPKVVCSAFIASPHRTAFVQQVARILGESGHPSRRLFTDVPALLDWVRPHVTAPELAAAEAFLAAARDLTLPPKRPR